MPEDSEQDTVHPHVHSLVRSLERQRLSVLVLVECVLDLLMNEGKGVAAGWTDGATVGAKSWNSRIVEGEATHWNNALFFPYNALNLGAVVAEEVRFDGFDVVFSGHLRGAEHRRFNQRTGARKRQDVHEVHTVRLVRGNP